MGCHNFIDCYFRVTSGPFVPQSARSRFASMPLIAYFVQGEFESRSNGFLNFCGELCVRPYVNAKWGTEP